MKNFILHIAFLFISLSVFGQERFYAKVNSNKVAANQRLQYTITLENANGKNLRPPDFTGLTLVGGPMTSNNMSYVNGQMSRSKSWTYYLKPIKEGSVVIAEASIEVGGKSMLTKPITISVTASSNSGQQAQKGKSNQSSGGTKAQVNTSEIADNVFVKLLVSKNSVYVGEQLTARLKLYYRADIRNTSVSKSPTFNGFWSQQIETSQSESKLETFNGKRYYTVILDKYALFPQRAGTLEISPMELETTVLQKVKSKPRSMLEQMMGGGYKINNVPFTFRSNPATINVKALPKNKPENFNGAVGRYNLECSIDKLDVKTDDAINLKVKISGQGNIRMIEMPEVETPPNFEVYDPEVNEAVSKKSTTVNGSKTYEFLMVPRTPGSFTIPSIEFSYFDPGQSKYVTKSSGDYEISVSGEPSQAGQPVIVQKEEAKLIEQDLRFIDVGEPELKPKSKAGFFASPIHLGLTGIPILGFFFLLFVKRIRVEANKDQVAVNRRKANKVAIKRLAIAKGYLDNGDNKAFYDECLKAIWTYLGKKFNIEPSQLSKDNVTEHLEKLNVSSESKKDLLKIIEDCQMALFAPNAIKGGMASIYDASIQIISKIESELK